MKCVLALCILLVVVYSLQGKPDFRQNRKPYGMRHPFVSNCEQNFNCGSGHYLGDPECVSASAVCNGVPDCSNGADENGCAYPNCWSRGMMQCSDRKTCANWCNDFPECPNLEDEIKCPTICPKGNLKCKDDKTCVESDQICDGYDDCPGGEDENRCNKKDILCSDVCDGNKQCSDGEDETNCLTDETFRSKFLQLYLCACRGDQCGNQTCQADCLLVAETLLDLLYSLCPQ